MTYEDTTIPAPVELADSIEKVLEQQPDASSPDHHYWIDVAKALGPALCQALYHAAVFTTRVEGRN